MAIVENQMVEVKINKNNKLYYQGLSYQIEENQKIIKVLVKDLPLLSSVSISLICDMCNCQFNQKYKNVSKRINPFCNHDCYCKFRKLNGSHNNTRVKVNCFECGKDLKVPQYRYKKLISNEVSFITCSRLCQNRYIGKQNQGENHHGYKEPITKKCSTCDEEFKVREHRENSAKYCSVKCQRIGVGKQNIPKKKLLVNCSGCNKEYFVWEHMYKKYDLHFCSNSCKYENAGMMVSKQRGKYDTKIQVIVNNILSKENIAFENEYPFGRFCVDNYLMDSNLVIEVMGDYWHSNPMVYETYTELNDTQKNRVRLDKCKKTYLNNRGVHVLYLWEVDITNDPDKCKALIVNFINSKGNLSDLNSFNYTLTDENKTSVNSNRFIPYFSKANTSRQKMT